MFLQNLLKKRKRKNKKTTTAINCVQRGIINTSILLLVIELITAIVAAELETQRTLLQGYSTTIQKDLDYQRVINAEHELWNSLEICAIKKYNKTRTIQEWMKAMNVSISISGTCNTTIAEAIDIAERFDLDTKEKIIRTVWKQDCYNERLHITKGESIRTIYLGNEFRSIKK